MGRPRKLDQDAENHIVLRVQIAKATGLFSRTALAEGFMVSVMTLRRYHSEKDRKASQVLALKAYERMKGSRHSNCDDCGHSLMGHSRCGDCRILIHDEPKVCRCGLQHGLTFDGRHCTNCIDTASRVRFTL